ncbi:MAG: M48 family metallopeptidase [Patescibacteria group bacterium]
MIIRIKFFKRRSRKEYLKNKERARIFVKEKLEYFNQFYNFNWQRISIRNQKRRWGSCSQKGNLNFNYKIIFLPEKCAGYIIVHELCHLKEFNHSRRFWELVVKTLPDYREIRKELRKL